MPPVVFVIMDAMRWDYLTPEDSPTLFEMANKGIHVKKLGSTVGFTQRSALFTGTNPETNGSLTMFVLDEEQSPYKFLGKYRFFLKLLQLPLNFIMLQAERLSNPVGDFFVKGCRFVLGRTRTFLKRFQSGVGSMSPSIIPLHLLHNFSISEDLKPIYEEGGLGLESIFDVMRKHNKKLNYLAYPIVDGDDEDTLRATLASIDSDTDLYVLQFSNSDGMVHLCGPETEERREIIKDQDGKIATIREAMHENGLDPVWFILGDHGMTEVKIRVDAYELITRLGRKKGFTLGKDYLIFVDSTVLRIWSLNDRAKSFVTEAMDIDEIKNNGVLIDADQAQKWKIPFGDRRYGDILWWANNGVLLYPDYFHDRGMHNRGMHGYGLEHSDSKGFAVVSGPNIDARKVDEAELIDACQTFAELLAVDIPSSNEGKSLL